MMPSFDPSIRTWEDYVRVYNYSLENNDAFWASVAQQKIQWNRTWSQVSDCDFNRGKIGWYLGAELNVAVNCLDRHLDQGKGKHPALIWVGNHPGEERLFTFQELHQEVCKTANALEALGIKKGDRVALYLPNIPELAISVLACARLGIIHTVIFGGFSAHSIHTRVNDCQAKLILTANGTYRGDKWIDLKQNVDQAMELGCPSVERVVVYSRDPQRPSPSKKLDLAWEDFLNPSLPRTHRAAPHSTQDPLFILYTSGSTGKPKGVLHTMGGYLTYVTYTYEIVFQPTADEIHWCTADMGWITGHSYLLYGPLANGTTTLMYEGTPTFPNPSRFWEIVDRYHVSTLYTAPTAIRTLASLGDQFVTRSSRKSLRVLGSVGEPINPEAWKWYSETVGHSKLPIVDTWWQTETGGILISPLAGITPTQPGSATLPLPGIEPAILDEKGQPLPPGKPGTLVIRRSWPGQMITEYGDPDRFLKTYFTQFKGNYCTGDSAYQEKNSQTEPFHPFWIVGRTDDVIKVSGHRLGSAEIESACTTLQEVAEAAAVGAPDPITGEALTLFVVARSDSQTSKALTERLISAVRSEVGALATPRHIYWVSGLPKTRSGKIMRRILRKLASGEFDQLGDCSTLADPEVVVKIEGELKSQLQSSGRDTSFHSDHRHPR